ncbi:MAG: hypothetical protein NTX88_03630 [Candidatus Atribacteria bacterium]|nr:hypothetical protein [Candidatus Atribacteria bacterium]
MKGDRWQLTYQNGHLAKIPVERVIFSWKKNFIRAGNSSHSWEVEMNLGMSTLPGDFVLGGRKTAWGIAGYSQEALTGNFAGQIHVEYNFPIQTINQPLLSRGLVKDISGKIYAEGGVVGRDTFPSESLFSLGAEVTLHSFIADEGMVSHLRGEIPVISGGISSFTLSPPGGERVFWSTNQ